MTEGKGVVIEKIVITLSVDTTKNNRGLLLQAFLLFGFDPTGDLKELQILVDRANNL